MNFPTDIRVVSAAIDFRPIQTRMPLKFGDETLDAVTCARVRLEVERYTHGRFVGWGETPLSVQWVWPGDLAYADRLHRLQTFCRSLVDAWPDFDVQGHALEVGHAFLLHRLPELLTLHNAQHAGADAMPTLASLVCNAPFDIAMHDAFGHACGLPVYETYRREFMHRDLAAYLQPAAGSQVSFSGRYPSDYLEIPGKRVLPAWHLVGGLDPLESTDEVAEVPADGYPVTLRDWIRRDGLKCLKVKLRGSDQDWDYHRLVRVGQIAVEEGVDWLSADFNCTVIDPAYVIDVLNRLLRDAPRVYGMVLYVEQPFPYDLDQYPLDVHCISARKPLFLDESAHDWRIVRQGRELGWTGVALKTCKTQTGTLLSLAWAKAHGMSLMVQDLTNPRLAQIPHVLLAAHAGTLLGVETNAMQFYPDASRVEAAVHPGIYQRRNGQIDLQTIQGPGFGYRKDEMDSDF